MRCRTTLGKWFQLGLKSQSEYLAALADIDRRLEIADENENVIERTARRERLLDKKAELEADYHENPSFGSIREE